MSLANTSCAMYSGVSWVPLRKDQQRRNANHLWLPRRLASAPIVDDVLEHAIGRAQYRRVLLRAHRIGREGGQPPGVEPRGRADFLDTLRRNSANATLPHNITGSAAV